MRKKPEIARVVKIEARHYSRRAFRSEHAKMSLWAETDLGHRVWLCKSGCDTRRIETKLREFEDEYSFLVGQEIKYTLKNSRYGFEDLGFLTPRGTTPEYYRPKINLDGLKASNKSIQSSNYHLMKGGEER